MNIPLRASKSFGIENTMRLPLLSFYAAASRLLLVHSIYICMQMSELMYQNASFYQDRLGTKVAKALKKSVAFPRCLGDYDVPYDIGDGPDQSIQPTCGLAVHFEPRGDRNQPGR
jgi:hypothetical protein